MNQRKELDLLDNTIIDLLQFNIWTTRVHTKIEEDYIEGSSITQGLARKKPADHDEDDLHHNNININH